MVEGSGCRKPTLHRESYFRVCFPEPGPESTETSRTTTAWSSRSFCGVATHTCRAISSRQNPSSPMTRLAAHEGERRPPTPVSRQKKNPANALLGVALGVGKSTHLNKKRKRCIDLRTPSKELAGLCSHLVRAELPHSTGRSVATFCCARNRHKHKGRTRWHGLQCFKHSKQL